MQNPNKYINQIITETKLDIGTTFIDPTNSKVGNMYLYDEVIGGAKEGFEKSNYYDIFNNAILERY